MATAIDVHPLTQLLKALGDESRLRLVALLAQGELCVCHLHEALELSQPNVSRQLAILRHAGVVAVRREGPWMYYRLAPQTDERRRGVLKTIVDGFAREAGLRRDVRSVRKSCGPGAGA